MSVFNGHNMAMPIIVNLINLYNIRVINQSLFLSKPYQPIEHHHRKSAGHNDL